MIPLISTMRETATSTTAEYNMVICYRLALKYILPSKSFNILYTFKAFRKAITELGNLRDN